MIHLRYCFTIRTQIIVRQSSHLLCNRLTTTLMCARIKPCSADHKTVSQGRNDPHQHRLHKQRKNTTKLDMLREHKPPPNTAIRRIQISDFGLPDPKRDPDRHQNCITWSLSHALAYKKFRQNPFTSLRVIRRTDRHTVMDRTVGCYAYGNMF